MTPDQQQIIKWIIEYNKEMKKVGIDDWPTMSYLRKKKGVERSTMSNFITGLKNLGYVEHVDGWKSGQSKRVKIV